MNQTVFDPTGVEQVNMNYYIVFKRCIPRIDMFHSFVLCYKES
jgi:hypothetical protein